MPDRTGFEDCYIQEPSLFPYSTQRALEAFHIFEKLLDVDKKGKISIKEKLAPQAFELIEQIIHEAYMQGREDEENGR